MYEDHLYLAACTHCYDRSMTLAFRCSFLSTASGKQNMCLLFNFDGFTLYSRLRDLRYIAQQEAARNVNVQGQINFDSGNINLVYGRIALTPLSRLGMGLLAARCHNCKSLLGSVSDLFVQTMHSKLHIASGCFDLKMIYPIKLQARRTRML